MPWGLKERGRKAMRGKKPKERECYVLRMDDGTLVAVDRKIYLEWHQSRRREKYQRERGRKYGVYSLDDMEEKGCVPCIDINVTDGPEETALRDICREKLREALRGLRAQDAYLMQLLYFEEATVKDVAHIFGCSRKSIQNRRKRVLNELCRILQELGVQGGCF